MMEQWGFYGGHKEVPVTRCRVASFRRERQLAQTCPTLFNIVSIFQLINLTVIE